MSAPDKLLISGLAAMLAGSTMYMCFGLTDLVTYWFMAGGWLLAAAVGGYAYRGA